MDVVKKSGPEFVKKAFPDPKPTCTMCGDKQAIVGLEPEKGKGLWLCGGCLEAVTRWCFMIMFKEVQSQLSQLQDDDATKH